MFNKKTFLLNASVSVVITLIGCLIVGASLSHPVQKIAPVVSAPVSVDDLQQRVTSAYNLAAASVVNVHVSKNLKAYIDNPANVTGVSSLGSQSASLGGASGIFVHKDGYILTSKHVVADMKASYEVSLQDGTSYPVEKIWLDPVFDLAVLKISGAENTPVAQFLPFDTQATVGQFVISIGNAFNEFPYSASFGIISAKSKPFKISGTKIYVGLYQTDAKAAPGNSGGPLLDLQGNVIGITTALADAQGIAFALPVSTEFIQTLLTSIQQYNAIVRPLLGVEYVDITPAMQKEKGLAVSGGILLTSVLTDMPAQQAGLQKGDIVLAINKKPITTEYPFLYHIYTAMPESTVTLTVLRAGDTSDMPLVLGKNAQ